MRLIDRQKAIDSIAFGITYAKAFNKETGEVKELFAQGNYELRKAVDRIKEMPSVDAVEVVRCKDCKHNSLKRMSGNTYCDLGMGLFQLYDFCSLGERRINNGK